MGRKMRVLVTADVVGERPTGVAQATRMLVSALQTQDDVETSVLIAPGSDPAGWDVPIVRADWRIPGMPFVFTRHHKLETFDIIHCSTVRVPFTGRPSGPRLVMTVHDLVPLVAPEYHTMGHRLYFRHLLRRSLRKFDAVVTDSEATRADLVEKLGIPEKMVSVVPLYARWPPVEKVEPQSETFVLAVGTIEPRKNIRRAIEAFLKVRERNPGLRHHLIIAGAAGWGKQDPFEIPEAMKSAVTWRGYVSDEELRELYLDAAVLLYPSFYEGFGLPVLEAMSLGCPVITSDRSSLPEVGGDAVVYVNPKDVDDIAYALERLLRHEQLRNEMRSKGLQQAGTFSAKRMGEQLLELYRLNCGSKVIAE